MEKPHFFLSSQALNTNIVILYPFNFTSVSQGTISSEEPQLTVFSIEYGAKCISFMAFDLSELPEKAIPNTVVLKIKTKAIAYSCWISAFCSSSTNWVQTEVTWDTKPELGHNADAIFIDTMNEWYSWESDTFTRSVIQAFEDTKKTFNCIKNRDL